MMTSLRRPVYITVIAISLLFTVFVYAEGDKVRCTPTTWSHDCYNMIMEQNDEIIEKLDRIECLTMHKASYYYEAGRELFEMQSPEKLSSYCDVESEPTQEGEVVGYGKR